MNEKIRVVFTLFEQGYCLLLELTLGEVPVGDLQA